MLEKLESRELISIKTLNYVVRKTLLYGSATVGISTLGSAISEEFGLFGAGIFMTIAIGFLFIEINKE